MPVFTLGAVLFFVGLAIAIVLGLIYFTIPTLWILGLYVAYCLIFNRKKHNI